MTYFDLTQDLRISFLSTGTLFEQHILRFNDVTIKHGTLKMLPINSHLINLSSVTVSNEAGRLNEDIITSDVRIRQFRLTPTCFVATYYYIHHAICLKIIIMHVAIY